MYKKIFYISAILVIFFSLTACGNKYNAVMYDDAGEWIVKEFREANLTRGTVYFEGEELDETETLAYPEDRAFIIKDQDKYNKIFIDSPIKLEFGEDMLIIYFFTDNFTNTYKIKEMNLEDSVLKIYYKVSLPHKQSSAPLQRCFAIKVDNLDIESAKLIKA